MTRLRWIQLHGLGVLAFAQPLLDQLGRNPTFFVAHRTPKATIVLVGVLVFVLPGLGAAAVVWLADRLAPRYGTALFHGLIALFTAVVFLPPLSRMFDQQSARSIPPALLIGIAASIALFNVARIGTFLAYLGLMATLVPVVFLGISSTADLLWGAEVEAIGVGGNDTPVVMITLDEFALGAIVDNGLNLDTAKVPNLAAFAAEATWYRNTVANWAFTNRAVPSLLTGQVRADIDNPIASAHPQNLFTLTAPSHELAASEVVTALCPATLCSNSNERDPGSLLSDTRTVLLHSVLPGDLADKWLPPITDSWAGFGDTSTNRVDDAVDPGDLATFPEAATDRAADLDAFTASLPDAATPTVSFLHSLLPHTPFEYVPSGVRYDGFYLRGIDNGSLDWNTDRDDLLLDHKRRYLLQIGFLDVALGELFAELRSKTWYDDALIVVSSDHGVSFEIGSNKRRIDDTNLSDVAFVPLLIKYPNQGNGMVSDMPAQTIDVLPTIADVLDIGLANPVDGQSLLDADANVTRSVDGYAGPSLEDALDLRASVEHFATAVPANTPATTARGSAETRELLGQSVRDLNPQVNADGFVEVANLNDFAAVTLGPWLPLRVQVATSGDFGDTAVVAIGGVVVSSAPLIDGRADVLIDPGAIAEGFNNVEAFGFRDGQLVQSQSNAPDPYATITAEVSVVGDNVAIGDQQWAGANPDHAGFAKWQPDRGVIGWVGNTDSGAIAEHVLVMSDNAVAGVDGDRTRRIDVVRTTGDARLLWSGFAFTPPAGFDPASARVLALFSDGTRMVMPVLSE